MSICAGRNKRRPMFRSNSSRGSVFANNSNTAKIDETISRTFSLSSSEAGDDDHDDHDGRCCLEGFDDEHHLERNAANMITNVPDLRVPLEIAHVPREASAFFMETMIRRDETKKQFILYLQSTQGAQPIFCAQKYPPSDGGQILIKSMDTASGNSNNHSNHHTILGSLVKKKRRGTKTKKKNANLYTSTTTTTYELMLHETASNGMVATSSTGVASEASPMPTLPSNESFYLTKKKSQPLVVATIDYEQMSKARYLIEGAKPRRARVTLLGQESAAETKVPHQQANGQKVLDFGGRGLETSSKNTQLVVSNNTTSSSGDKSDFQDDSSCCLQMVKWKDHEFNLDFGPPFNAFQAFAFALAQFDF